MAIQVCVYMSVCMREAGRQGGRERATNAWIRVGTQFRGVNIVTKLIVSDTSDTT